MTKHTKVPVPLVRPTKTQKVLEEMKRIFKHAQETSANQEKYVIQMIDLYKKSHIQAFVDVFLKFILTTLKKDHDSFIYTKRVLCFISKFCAEITKKEERELDSHCILNAVIEQALTWSSVSTYAVRYHSCFLIFTILQDIGEDIQFEQDLITKIQAELLVRMQEAKVPLRLLAIKALVRLQVPQDMDCPVISAFLEATMAANAAIRKCVVENIAPNKKTLPVIKDRIKDVDPHVRSAALKKCADIGPKVFRIVDKHFILMSGFQEEEANVKSVFREILFPKWLTAYKGNFLHFIDSLMLLANDEDVKKLKFLCDKVVREFLTTHAVDDVIAALPINEHKFLDIDNFTHQAVLFWSILINVLRENEEWDDQLSLVMPEMAPFCEYLEIVIKRKSTMQMDEWERFDFHFDLLNLIEIAENFDYSDEFGRNALHGICQKLVQDLTLPNKLVEKLVKIWFKCNSDMESFTLEVWDAICDLRDHEIEQLPTEAEKAQYNFKTTTLKVKKIRLEDDLNSAVETQNYKQAQIIQDQIKEIEKQLQDVPSMEPKTIRITRSDDETLCRCLDILASALKIINLSKLNPCLLTCKDQFLLPLVINTNPEVHFRMMKCLSLFCLLDETTAKEYGKLLCVPLITYNNMPVVTDVKLLLHSIAAVTDLVTLYNFDIIGEEKEVETTKRKLYNDKSTSLPQNEMSPTVLLEILVTMLEDEREDVRSKAAASLLILMICDFPVTHIIFSKVLLKWFTPLTGKTDVNLQGFLGRFVDMYVKWKNAETIQSAIIPTLNMILKAPRSSPLTEIEIDNVVTFFSEVMNLRLTHEEKRDLALDMCNAISENVKERVTPFLTKFLCGLKIKLENPDLINELIECAENLAEKVLEKYSKRNMEKMVFNLRESLTALRTNCTQNETNGTQCETNANENMEEDNETNTNKNMEEDNETNTNEKENVHVNESEKVKEKDRKSIMRKSQVKRRKGRGSKNCVVVLERMDLNKTSESEMTLHTILEENLPMEIDENLTEENSGSESSSVKTLVVVTDTDSNDEAVKISQERSTRVRKKRIV